MTEWTRLRLVFQRAVIAHQLAAHPTVGSAARHLGMHPSNFRRILARQRRPPPVDGR